MKKTLNIGCGNRTYSEYPPGHQCINYDNRAELTHVDILGDARNLEKFQSEEFDYILASDIIEHFPIAETSKIITEWMRVLKPGGIIEFRLPDLETICKDYVNKSSQNRTDKPGDVPITEFFSWVIFGGQDFPGNFHHVGFDRRWFRYICNSLGLEEISWEIEGYNMTTRYKK